jgi:hypothetical protein
MQSWAIAIAIAITLYPLLVTISQIEINALKGRKLIFSVKTIYIYGII